ncbi:OsmC family protein [Skermanella mucosa]|uniref:OsmC family protein n=1 Tax=Skermanella mucosa TaxID=1789672 RepID=UPI00192BE26D|nr:OsmC family protein [Skermanella mucosa]UEM21826.1 OsmC family protein [Skermanella mucosa]
MDAETLKAVQAPLKQRYRDTPESAVITLKAEGTVGAEGVTCKVDTGRALVEAGLHPAAGGDGIAACSGDMLLEALVACAGVTLRAVATALNIDLRGGTVRAEGDLDMRGTLGVSKEAPVGFRSIRMTFDLDTDADDEKLASLLKLTERYCVIYQTLRNPPATEARIVRSSDHPAR